jgi:hypothetical protein
MLPIPNLQDIVIGYAEPFGKYMTQLEEVDGNRPHEEIIEMFEYAMRGCKPDKKTFLESSALIVVCKFGTAKMIENLRERFSLTDNECLNMKDSELEEDVILVSQTLEAACQEDNLEVVEWLASNFADEIDDQLMNATGIVTTCIDEISIRCLTWIGDNYKLSKDDCLVRNDKGYGTMTDLIRSFDVKRDGEVLRWIVKTFDIEANDLGRVSLTDFMKCVRQLL